MKRKAFITTAFICCFMVCLAAIVDVNGKWTGTLVTPDGNEVQVNYIWKVDGDKLTGTAESDGIEVKIDSGKVSGNDITFNITNPQGVTIKQNAKYIATGDSISMNIDYQGTKMHTTLKHPATK